MRKIILCLMALSLSWSAVAQFHQIAGDPVDYSRLRLPRDKGSYPLTYTMSFEHHTNEDFFYDMMIYWMTGDKSEAEKDNIGWTDVVFTGELRHTRDISPEMLERAIQAAFLQTGLNRPLLKIRQEQASKLKKVVYTDKEFLMDMAGAVLFALPFGAELSAGVSLALNGAGAALSVASLAYDSSDIIANIVNSGSLELAIMSGFEDALAVGGGEAARVLGTGGKVVSALGTVAGGISVGMSMHNAAERTEQTWKNREGASALWQINSFYNWANYYLDMYSKESGKDAWVLLINSASEPSAYMFRNTPCNVVWALDAKLVKCQSMPRRPDRLNYEFEGEYCGLLEAVSFYDLSGYTEHFLNKWGNWADDYLLQGKGFKAPGMLGSGDQLDGDAMFQANWCYNDPMEQGSKLYSHKAEASMAGRYHIPVYFELQATGAPEGTLNGNFVHLMWMNKDDFDGQEIARSFGFSAANPDQMYKTEMRMDTRMSGLVFPRVGDIPAETVEISEQIDGEKYIYNKVEKKVETLVTHEEIPLRDEHGVINFALPEGAVSIDLGAVLGPTFEIVPQDRKDWEKIKEKWF